ncbi:hypothetical protein [Asticcacaulis sp.]|uniref:hypothetical protein n=1 Tax=Asticcacaulis sp. TaxID=1872648 RepID=UPI002C4DB2D0|nr:hypothetical protein [Asticcacaulis sp.]HTM80615.1 hypothetical protein [Asticcacaulis sp.]
MAFLIMTRAGLDTITEQFDKFPPNLWVNQGVLTEVELQTYRGKGISITNFTYDIPLNDRAAISDAMETISEHHPDEVVYVEWTSC